MEVSLLAAFVLSNLPASGASEGHGCKLPRPPHRHHRVVSVVSVLRYHRQLTQSVTITLDEDVERLGPAVLLIAQSIGDHKNCSELTGGIN